MAKQKIFAKRKRVDFISEYKRSWKYVTDSRNFIFSSVILFFLAFLAGFAIPAPEFVESAILNLIQEILQKTQEMGFAELAKFIFLNNAKTSFVAMIFGIAFSFVPVIFSLFNGYLLGFVASATAKSAGFSSLWRIFPHGIFELPAIFISFGLGIRLGLFIFTANEKNSFKDYIVGSLKVFLLIIIPLLIIAAVIESLLISFWN